MKMEMKSHLDNEEYQLDRDTELGTCPSRNNDIYDNQPSPNISITNTASPKEVRKPSSLQKKKKPSNYVSETASSTLMKYILEKKDEENLEQKAESSAMDQFFLSMCSTVKQFSPYNQHLAKTKIFSIVSEIELDSLRQTQQQPLFQPIPQSISNLSNDQHQQAYHQSPNNRFYPLHPHSENNQQVSNSTPSATSFFQNFQAGTDNN